MQPRPKWDRLTLPAIAFSSTLLMGLATPPNGVTALLWLGYWPLTWVARRPDVSVRYAFWLGWLGGLCAGLVGFPWIGELLMRFAGFPAPVSYSLLLVFSAWTAVPFGLWTAGMRSVQLQGWRSWLFGVALWVALADLWPAIFPYTVVIGFAEFPAWMQAAEIGGVAAVEAQVVLFGMLLADGLGARDRRLRPLQVGAAMLIPLLSMALGFWRMAALDDGAAEARTVKFGIVQPNNPLRWPNRRGKVDRLRLQSLAAQQQGAQVVVWPEAGVYPFRMRRPFLKDYDDKFRKILKYHRLPTIFGAPSYDDTEYDYNTVFNMGADGAIRGSFDKVHLMPLGEYIPIVDPKWARKHVPAMSHNHAGKGPARFEVDPARTPEKPGPEAPFAVGPLICYEDIIAGFARETAAQPGGIEVFANLTIDAWFGVTAEPWEHLALAQYRSVEHRIPMVRSVSTGVSAIVDHAGRVQAHIPVRGPTLIDPLEAELLVDEVALPRNTAESPTVYARGGWLLPHLCQLGLVCLAVAGLVRRKYTARSRSPDPHSDRD